MLSALISRLIGEDVGACRPLPCTGGLQVCSCEIDFRSIIQGITVCRNCASHMKS